MSAAANRREQTLLGATVLTGLFAFLSQAGVPLGCSAQQIAMGKVPAGAGAGDLVSGLDLRAKSDHKHIEQGTKVKLNDGPTEVLVGVDPTHATVITARDNTIHSTPIVKIDSVAVVGGSRAGPGAGYGALIGGVTGAIVGGAVSNDGQRTVGVVCLGGGGAALGTGVGAIGGAVVGPPEAVYLIGPNDWHIDRGEPPKPSNGPPKPPSAVPTPTTLHPDDPAP